VYGVILIVLLEYSVIHRSVLSRFGYLLVTTLPTDYSSDENGTFIYATTPLQSPTEFKSPSGNFSFEYPDGIQIPEGVTMDERELKKIRLRNMLLELLNSLLIDESLELDLK